MGWFNKTEEIKKEGPKPLVPQLPRLPELPELPALPSLESRKVSKEPIPQLPSFPKNTLGEKFSQNTIKDTISGNMNKRDSYMENEEEDNVDISQFAQPRREMPMVRKTQPLMPKIKGPLKRVTMEVEPEEEEFEEEGFEEPDYEEEEEFEEPKYEEGRIGRGGRSEPVFIRIDKFEESLKAFQKAKKEIAEIEKLLTGISKIKEEEERQLESWQNDIIKVKEQIQKVDDEIFSKLE